MTRRSNPPAAAVLAVALTSFAFASVVAISAQQARPAASASELQIMPLRGNVFLLHGAGANITVSVAREGILLVDAGSAAMGDRVVTAIRELARQITAMPATVKPCFGTSCLGVTYPAFNAAVASPAPPPPIRYLVNTNADGDHVGGNATVSQAGTTYGSGPGLGQFQNVVRSSAMVYAHENVLQRLAKANVPTAGLPTESFVDDFKQYINGEGIQMIHFDAGHTDGDVVVHFRGADVISTGDIFSTVSFPVVDVERGGSINGIVRGLNQLLDMVIAEYQTEGGTLLVPGHGRISDAADLASYRDAVTIMRDRVQAMIQRGMTLEQIKAARPTKDYDPRYERPEWTRDQFVEAMYKSLAAPTK